MHMQRRQQAETTEGRLSPDLTPVEAEAGLDLSLPRRLQRLPPPQGRQSAPAEGDLKIPTGESGLSRVRLALGNRCPKHGAMWQPGPDCTSTPRSKLLHLHFGAEMGAVISQRRSFRHCQLRDAFQDCPVPGARFLPGGKFAHFCSRATHNSAVWPIDPL